MRNEEEKIELEREVSELENQVYDLTGYRNNRNELKGQYANNKRDYKRFYKKVTKIKGIRNLKVMGNVALFLVPFVVCGSVFAGSFVDWDALISSTRTVDFGDEAKIVSMDSTGGYDEKLNRFGCNDSITINTKWFKENENLVRYTYEVEEGIDFHTKEEIENVVFKDYFTLLNEYKFTETNKEVAEFTEDRASADLGEDIVSVKAGLGINEEEKKEINSSIDHNYGDVTFLSIALAGISGLFFGLFYPRFGNFKNAIKQEVADARSELAHIPDLKKEKKKLKEFKRKIK